MSWDNDQEYRREEKKKEIFLKSKGWKIVKSEYGVFAKHSDYGMTTVDRAIRVENGEL